MKNDQLDEFLFQQLKHPVRQQLLLELGQKNPSTFNELKRVTSLSSGRLTHHLKHLPGLVHQNNENGYTLSHKGQKIYQLLVKISNFEITDKQISLLESLSLLQNRLRRQILIKIEQEGNINFNNLKITFNLKDSKLRYHLRKLNHFISHNKDKQYILTPIGGEVLNIVEQVSSPIANLELLFEEGKYKQALDLITVIEEEERSYGLNHPSNRFIETQIYKSYIFEKQGHYKDALNLAERLLSEVKPIQSQSPENKILYLKALLAKVNTLFRQGKSEDCLKDLSNDFLEHSQFSKKNNFDLQLILQKLLNVKGKIYHKIGNYNKALSIFQQAMNIGKAIGNKQELAQTFDDMGFIYFEKGEFDLALKNFTKSLDYRKEVGNKQDIAHSLNNIGKILWQNGNYDQALNFFQQSLILRKEIGNKDDIAGSLGDIGTIYFEKGDLDQALDWYQQSLALYKEMSNNEAIGKTMGNIGLALRAKGDLEKALEFLQKSLVLKKKTGNKDISRSLYNIGVIYLEMGNLDRTLEHYQQALILAKELGNKKMIANSLASMGIVNWEKGDLDQALEFYQQSLTLNKEMGDKKGFSTDLNNIGSIYSDKGDLDQALEFYQQSLALKKEIGDKQLIPNTLNNIGEICLNKGNLEQALEFYQQGLILAKELGIKGVIIYSLYNIGQIHQYKGKLEQASEFYQQAITLAKELGNKLLIAMILKNFGDIFLNKGNLDQALDHYQQSLALRKEMGNKLNVARSLIGMGLIYWHKGNTRKSLKTLHQSLEIFETYTNKLDLSRVLFYIIVVFITFPNNNIEQGKKYFQKIQEIQQTSENKIIYQYSSLTQALILKKSKRIRDKGKAEELFLQLINGEIIDHELIVIALIHYCEMLLHELEQFRNNEIIKEIHTIIDRLMSIATEQESLLILGEINLLQAKFAYLREDFQKTQDFLREAEQIAQKHHLTRLKRRIPLEKQLIEKI